MNEFSSPTAEPNYIARLALQSAPFNTAVDPAIFFKGEQIEQSLNLLLHLIRASDKVGLLLAEQGLGKSTLISQLQKTKGDDLRICRINGHTSLTSIEIITQCLTAFGVDDKEVQFSNDHLMLLKDRLSRLQQLNIKPLLLIDDIDLLTEEPLVILMNCLSWQSGESYLLSAVFSAKQNLAALATIHGRLQRIDLPALTEAEVVLYVSYRLAAVGYVGEPVFNTNDLKQCYKQSLGKPALINQWAHQHLLGMKPSLTSPIKLNVGNIVPLLKWSGLGILVISLILLLLFQDTINGFFSPKTNDEVAIEKPFTTQEETLTKVIIGEDKVTSSSQAGREELASLVAELPAVESQKEVIKAKELQEDISDVASTVIESKVAPITTLPIKPPNDIHHQEWVLEQNGTDYTFQLMGSWDKNEVNEFLDKYALTGDVAEFESMRSGRVWYALIYGVYDSKQAALDASHKWPAPLNTLPSWLRRFDSVQQQIKKAAPAQ